MCRGDAETSHSVPLKLLPTSLSTHWFLLESCTVMVVIVLVPLSLVCVSAGFLLARQKFPFLKFRSARFTSPRFMQWVIILCICRIYFDAQLFLIWPVEDNWKEEPTRFFFPLPLSLLRTVPVHRQPWQLG